LECSAISLKESFLVGEKPTGTYGFVLLRQKKFGRSKWAGTRPWILLVEYSCYGVALCDDLVGFQARPVTWDYEL
jgi:hypothetical protein